MAIRDGNDRYDAGDSGGDWWSQNAPPPTVPPGYQLNPQTGQVEPLPATLAAPPQTGAEPNFDPNVNYQTTWSAGPNAQPTDVIPGWHWDPSMARFIKDAPQGTETPNPVPGGVDPGTTTPGTITGNTGAVPQGVPTSGFGSAPAPYASNPNAPVYQPMATYVPPTWTGGDYKNPTQADLEASPGYFARLAAGQQARERAAAARGTVLNGGTVKALDRSAQDYATNEYQTLRNNTYDAYVQKYKQFTDAAGMDLNARTVNANENQNTFANRTSTFNTANTRNLSDYITNVTNNRNSELDYWNRLQDVNQTGANLAGASR